MAALGALRDGLKTRLATISGLRTHDTVPGQINPPAAIVIPDITNYDATMQRGSDEHEFLIQLVVSAAWDRTSQDKLDAYLDGSGATSVKAAIEADETLGGVAFTTRVARMDDYGWVTFGETQYFGATLHVEVTTSGT